MEASPKTSCMYCKDLFWHRFCNTELDPQEIRDIIRLNFPTTKGACFCPSSESQQGQDIAKGTDALSRREVHEEDRHLDRTGQQK